MKTDLALSVFSSALGWMAILTRGGAIVQISFGHRGSKAAREAIAASLPRGARLPPADGSLVRRLQSYARGRPEDFRDLRIELPACTPFQRRVTECCRQVRYGQTVTYGELAARAGTPGAARAVGNCMAANPLPLVVPCHRVVLADGRPGSYSAPGGTRMKERLLAMEQAWR